MSMMGYEKLGRTRWNRSWIPFRRAPLKITKSFPPRFDSIVMSGGLKGIVAASPRLLWKSLAA